MRSITLRALPGQYAISRLDPADSMPPWADGPGFVSISRSDEELSITCLEERVPLDVRRDGEWRCLMFVGPFAFEETGIVLSVIKPLSEGEVGVFVVSTFDGDYLLVKMADLPRALNLLAEAGHRLDAK